MTSISMERLTRRADDLRSQISQTGFAAIDDAFDVDVLEALSEEIDSLHYMASLKASMNSLTTGTGSTIAIKQGVEELDMKVHKKVEVSDSLLQSVPTLASLLDDSSNPLLRFFQAQFPTLQLNSVDQLKVTRAETNATCLPLHFDTSQSFQTRRMLTAVIYLSDFDESTAWPSPMGALRVYPIPFGVSSTLDPIRGRIAVFGSFFTPHRTLPMKSVAAGTHCRRVLSFWFSGLASDAEAASVFVPAVSISKSLPLLREATNNDDELIYELIAMESQRKFTKLALSFEYIDSIRDAFGDFANDAVTQHLKVCDTLRSTFSPKVNNALQNIETLLQAAVKSSNK